MSHDAHLLHAMHGVKDSKTMSNKEKWESYAGITGAKVGLALGGPAGALVGCGIGYLAAKVIGEQNNT